MTETVKTALGMIADPALAGKTWAEVRQNQRLSEDDDADGERFCSVMYSLWIGAELSRKILEGDDAELLKFMDTVDPKRTVRDRIPSR